MPALHHEGIHSTRTILWAWQQLARADHLYCLLIAVSIVGLKIIEIFSKADDIQNKLNSLILSTKPTITLQCCSIISHPIVLQILDHCCRHQLQCTHYAEAFLAARLPAI